MDLGPLQGLAGEATQSYQRLADVALLLGLSTTRVAVAFLLVPLFTSDLIPSLVRNAMFVAIALLGLLMQPSSAPVAFTTWQWITLYAKEAFIGGADNISTSHSAWWVS